MRADSSLERAVRLWGLDAWNALKSHRAMVALPGDARLTEQGTTSSLWLIVTGCVKLVAEGTGGRVAIIGVRSSGSLIGVAQALTEQPQSLAAYTIMPTSVVSFTRPEFAQLVESNRTVATACVRVLSRELATIQADWATLSTADTAERVDHVLRRAQAGYGDGDAEPVRLRQFEIAQAAMTSVQHLHRVVRRLEERGMIARRKGVIIAAKRME